MFQSHFLEECQTDEYSFHKCLFLKYGGENVNENDNNTNSKKFRARGKLQFFSLKLHFLSPKEGKILPKVVPNSTKVGE